MLFFPPLFPYLHSLCPAVKQKPVVVTDMDPQYTSTTAAVAVTGGVNRAHGGDFLTAQIEHMMDESVTTKD